MNRLTAKLVRVSVVVLTVSAWLSISNHCALGAMIAARAHVAMAAMHCHGDQPAPGKKGSEEEMPCCKTLRATVTTEAKIAPAATQNFLPIQDWVIGTLIFNDAPPSLPQEIDTGPPFADTFAESVLQRSILAHAPPLAA